MPLWGDCLRVCGFLVCIGLALLASCGSAGRSLELGPRGWRMSLSTRAVLLSLMYFMQLFSNWAARFVVCAAAGLAH